MVHQASDVVSDDRTIAGLIWRLESEGWSLAEHLILRSDGQLTWIVSGFNGPNAIRSEGANMAEAWAGASQQARTPTPGPARLNPQGSPWIISQEPGPTQAAADAGNRRRPVELQLGGLSLTLDDRGERDGAACRGDRPKPRHRGHRRADGTVHRGKDHARRANPNRY